MQSIIIIEKGDGKVTSVTETQVSDEVYVALQLVMRRSTNLEATARKQADELDALKQQLKGPEEERFVKGNSKGEART